MLLTKIVVPAARGFCLGTALISLTLLLAVVAINVVARLLFDLTDGAINFIIRGAIEISSYALLIFVFGALASAIPNGLVRVEIFIHRCPPLLTRVLVLLWATLLVIGLATLTFLFLDSAQLAADRGELTQDLELPMWLFYGAIAIQCAALTLIAVDNLFRQLGKQTVKPTGDSL